MKSHMAHTKFIKPYQSEPQPTPLHYLFRRHILILPSRLLLCLSGKILISGFQMNEQKFLCPQVHCMSRGLYPPRLSHLNDVTERMRTVIQLSKESIEISGSIECDAVQFLRQVPRVVAEVLKSFTLKTGTAGSSQKANHNESASSQRQQTGHQHRTFRFRLQRIFCCCSSWCSNFDSPDVSTPLTK